MIPSWVKEKTTEELLLFLRNPPPADTLAKQRALNVGMILIRAELTLRGVRER